MHIRRLTDYAANVHKEMSCVCDIIQRSTAMVTSNSSQETWKHKSEDLIESCFLF